MWPFKQKTIMATVVAAFEPPTTADGHRLDEMVLCVKCHRLVEATAAVSAKTIYDTLLTPTTDCPRWVEDHKEYEEWYCPDCAPKWDVQIFRVRRDTGQTIHYYRRIPAVPERLEEIVEAPVRATRKRKPKKAAS